MIKFSKNKNKNTPFWTKASFHRLRSHSHMFCRHLADGNRLKLGSSAQQTPQLSRLARGSYASFFSARMIMNLFP
jgi:hypothetical protein